VLALFCVLRHRSKNIISHRVRGGQE